MNDLAKNLILWVIIAVVLMSVFSSFGPRPSQAPTMAYSQLINEVRAGRVQKVEIKDQTLLVTLDSGSRVTTQNPNDAGLVGELLNNNVEIVASQPEQQSMLMQIFISW
ncbi:MAG: ATP-dependent metallopeptidase FtsH/Yme1/Tma family protein, partial [Gammaproteobacteria bacterium]|nr:ATP-dependent metallopeptidase FtsH/Yme1/Tma family protein [Gammaproteobacteria bacterium]